MLTLQQLLTTTKEKLMRVPITSFTITTTRTSIIIPNGNCKKIAMGDFVKAQINGLTTIPIKTHTTTINIIIANIVFATLINGLK